MGQSKAVESAAPAERNIRAYQVVKGVGDVELGLQDQ